MICRILSQIRISRSFSAYDADKGGDLMEIDRQMEHVAESLR